jgi:hypothetical protein
LRCWTCKMTALLNFSTARIAPCIQVIGLRTRVSRQPATETFPADGLVAHQSEEAIEMPIHG